jgi:hypothetical protein
MKKVLFSYSGTARGIRIALRSRDEVMRRAKPLKIEKKKV